MKRHSSRPIDDSQPIAFAKKHRFKDTLALFIVFLSFNHFASLCLLTSFVIATRFRNFLTNSFIALFLSKKPSPPMAEVSHVDDNIDVRYPVNGNDKKQSKLPSWRVKHSLSLPLLISEILVATILKLYGENYFLKPIENLALSILASSMINDPKDCLSYATSCSVLYAMALHVYQKVGIIQRFGGSSTPSDLGITFPTSLFKPSMPQDKGAADTGSFVQCQVMSWLSRYGRHLLYYVSFHVVVFQFSQSTLSQHYDDDKQKSCKKSVSLKSEPNKGSGQRVSSLCTAKNASENPNVNSALQHQQQTFAERLGSNSTSQDSNSSMAFPNGFLNYAKKSNKGKQRLPYFTGVVSQYEAFEASLRYESQDNSQTMATNVTIPSPTNSQGSDKVENIYTNQFYDVKVEFGANRETRNLKLDVTVTSNLENFIRHLFKRKNQHLIPPLWSIVVTLKTTNFEKRYLKESKEVTLTPSNSGVASENDSSDGSITPTASNSNICDEQASESVFNKLQSSKTMALIAQTAFDDYAQLHIVATNDNIFKKDDKDYKVCIVEIASNSITFHIENLHEGELIVLVNGVIWSEVSCALILEHEGEELVVVGGLVPSCPYDIQFINRLRQMEDYLISDLMVRTVGVKDATEKFEAIDFSFPSYYHRKFLSPLLTLKHSVLTTNTNLAEGRVKLKKTKKEVSKKLNGLRQDIDHYKSKISQNATNDEKNASKVESLKTAHQQTEATLCKLEDHLQRLTNEEFKLEEEYLTQKDTHLRRQMEYSKLQESFDNTLKEAELKRSKLEQELNQLNSKKEKLFAKRERLQREVNQNTVEFENLKSQFVSKREKDRVRRSELRAREANELEMVIKGLEQDISRLEGENGNLQKDARGM
ncbi:hypothetical protein HG536_0G01710 [Torulaspora globosa]|uniref:Uncharacterized protein n=1 Tax=Torulaspora globosa TaxID=48254 RepID=A0A7G3ZLC6_9SACH|nr:uncharacterized protein HG536_0G01710 [Torulaspora globosa]QLL34312.1 hypothetical protein HG536_0G01710 [Torulaspora globosa]